MKLGTKVPELQTTFFKDNKNWKITVETEGKKNTKKRLIICIGKMENLSKCLLYIFCDNFFERREELQDMKNMQNIKQPQ